VGHDEGVPEHRDGDPNRGRTTPQLTSEAAEAGAAGQGEGLYSQGGGKRGQDRRHKKGKHAGRAGVRQRYSGRMASGESLVQLPQGTVMGAMPEDMGGSTVPRDQGEGAGLPEEAEGQEEGSCKPY